MKKGVTLGDRLSGLTALTIYRQNHKYLQGHLTGTSHLLNDSYDLFTGAYAPLSNRVLIPPYSTSRELLFVEWDSDPLGNWLCP